eukprot:CAMPEP_0183409832 /NCGR_PEP_ID=MMETSP0370-20130417/19127_1 /TAXON_ID=268820 /ORGANISM="Peridinium aciculiferum, Strain PAER-2" /LENGTH=43 /DNA_ID= /DNA_START= /DNA_END= /DNA_ORIENTATION=
MADLKIEAASCMMAAAAVAEATATKCLMRDGVSPSVGCEGGVL